MDIKFFIGSSLDTLIDDTTTVLRAYVHDLAPFASGDLSATEQLKIAVENIAPDSRQDIASVELKDHVQADYLGSILGMERPNVHKDETLGLVSFGGDSSFYWFTFGRNQHRRMTEVLRFFVANKDNPEDPLDEDNAYLVEVDTREGMKKVLIQTNKNLGEKFAYGLFIDIEKGQVHLKDDTENKLFLDSEKQTWVLANKNGDKLTLSPDLIQGDTKVFRVNATDLVEINTKQTDIHSPIINLDGNTTNTGTIDVTGAATFASTVSITGALSGSAANFSGAIVAGGSVTSSGFSAPGGAWHMP